MRNEIILYDDIPQNQTKHITQGFHIRIINAHQKVNYFVHMKEIVSK